MAYVIRKGRKFYQWDETRNEVVWGFLRDAFRWTYYRDAKRVAASHGGKVEDR